MIVEEKAKILQKKFLSDVESGFRLSGVKVSLKAAVQNITLKASLPIKS